VDFVGGNTFGLSTMLLIWIGVAAFATVLLTFSAFGRKLYAVGTNPIAALLAGVNIKRVLVIPYVVSGASAALTGVLLLGFLGQAFVNMGDEYLFASAVAVAVGGASILGGKGHYIGTVAGAIILTLIAANLNLLSLGQSAIQISYGLILLATVYLATIRLGRR
jgi:ribose transport system permease protein